MSQTLSRNGVQISFDVRGSGSPVLLLHAFPFDRRMWDDAARALEGDHRVIRMDYRGAQDSSLGSSGAFSIAELADDAAALLDHLGVPMASVMGLSMGGYVALAFAVAHPARLGSLVLADTRAGADTEAGRSARAEGIAKVRSSSAGLREFLDAMVPKLVAPSASEEVRARVRGLMVERAEFVAAALGALRDRPDRTAALTNIEAPTLVIVGEHDALTPPSEARILAEGIKGAELRVLEGAGHLANLETPEAFNEIVSDFLAREP